MSAISADPWERIAGRFAHRLGFMLKRPKKHLLKADEEKREAFVAEYVVLVDQARRSRAKIFCVDEAHFRASPLASTLRARLWICK